MSSGDRSNAKGKINLKRKEIASRTHNRGVAGKTQIEAKKSENLKRNLRKTTWLWRITRKIAGEGSRKQTPTTRERIFFSLASSCIYNVEAKEFSHRPDPTSDRPSSQAFRNAYQVRARSFSQSDWAGLGLLSLLFRFFNHFFKWIGHSTKWITYLVGPEFGISIT